MTLRAARPSLPLRRDGRLTGVSVARLPFHNSKPRMPISAVAAIRISHHGIFSSTLAPIKRAGAGTLRRPRQHLRDRHIDTLPLVSDLAVEVVKHHHHLVLPVRGLPPAFRPVSHGQTTMGAFHEQGIFFQHDNRNVA